MAKALNQTRVSEVLGIDYLIIQGLSAVDFLFNKKISSREELTFAAA